MYAIFQRTIIDNLLNDCRVKITFLKSGARKLTNFNEVEPITLSKRGRNANQSQISTTYEIRKLYKKLKLQKHKKLNGPRIIYGGLHRISMQIEVLSKREHM